MVLCTVRYYEHDYVIIMFCMRSSNHRVRGFNLGWWGYCVREAASPVVREALVGGRLVNKGVLEIQYIYCFVQFKHYD